MTEPAGPPEVMQVEMSDLRAALGAGLGDFRAAPLYGLFFGSVYVLGGWIIWWALTGKGQLWWTLVAGAGFPLLAPFLAVGIYEVSRRLEAGQPLDRSEIFGVILRQKERQIPSMAAVVVIFFLFWNFLAHMIFALFLGRATLTNITTSLTLFTTPEGLTMLAVGTGAGALIAMLFYAITVISLPLLLDREVDFVTAMLTSVAVVRTAPLVMLAWAVLIGAVLLLSMVPGFLGLLVSLPVFGHASWHLYRRAIAPEPQAPH